MNPFKLDLSGRSTADKLTLGSTHLTAMADNTHYPAASRVPTDAQLQTAQTELQTATSEALDAELQWREKIEQRKVKEAAWEQLFAARANWCACTTPDNSIALTSTGFPLRRPSLPLGTLAAPDPLRAEPGAARGSVLLRCQALNGAGSYEWQGRPTSSPEAWSPLGITTAAKLPATGLPPGALYDFRVRAIGAAGPSDWSDESSARVP